MTCLLQQCLVFPAGCALALSGRTSLLRQCLFFSPGLRPNIGGKFKFTLRARLCFCFCFGHGFLKKNTQGSWVPKLTPFFSQGSMTSKKESIAKESAFAFLLFSTACKHGLKRVLKTKSIADRNANPANRKETAQWRILRTTHLDTYEVVSAMFLFLFLFLPWRRSSKNTRFLGSQSDTLFFHRVV